MSVRTWLVWLAAGVCLAAAVMPDTASASIFYGGKRYVVAPGDTVGDDLLLWTNEGAFDGVMTQDLIMFCRRYKMTGQVQGNIFSASQYATVRGTVDRSARIFAQTATIDGIITNNLIVFASDIELSRNSRVGRDANLTGGEISTSGEIGRNLTIHCGQAIISGKISGDVDITADKISIVAPAEILGSIKYKSKDEIQIDNGVVISGAVERLKIEKKDTEDEGVSWPFRFVLFLCALVTGLIITAVFKPHTGHAVAAVLQKPLVTLGVGFVGFCIAPIAILVLCLTVIGIPAGIILLFVFTVFFYIAKIYVAIVLGRLIIGLFHKTSVPKTGWALLLGLFIMFLVFAIPYLGFILYLGTIFIGMGAIALGLRACRIAAAGSPASPSGAPPPVVQ
ncbi:MAG: polymer-forming cytoskeletal protein [candidate division Zixibacteria bacterium]|nr:polymer-forming cytoskeletal protein [candidate division Zixibacteria bacterium]